MKPFLTVLLLLGVIWCSLGLNDFDNYREGACTGIWSKSKSDSSRQQDIDIDWVDTLHYNIAGSKYHMYKMASPLHRYESMTEDEFYYDFCYKRNTSSSSPVGVGKGFGRILETWDVRTRPDLPGVYIEATPRTHFPKSDVLRQRITLTDNKSFAFLLDCWVGFNERAWNVVSNTPKLSPQAKRMIENHAVALGFSKKNFVFLRYDSCEFEKDHHDDMPWSRKGSDEIVPLIGDGRMGNKGPNPSSSWKPAPIRISTTPKPITTTTTTTTTPKPPLKRLTIAPKKSDHGMHGKNDDGMHGKGDDGMHGKSGEEGSGWTQ